MDTFLLSLGASEPKPAKKQSGVAQADNNQPSVVPATGNSFQEELNNRRQTAAPVTDEKKTGKSDVHETEKEAGTTLVTKDTPEQDEGLVSSSAVLLLSVDQTTQQDRDQADMEISKLPESTSPIQLKIQTDEKVAVQDSEDNTVETFTELDELDPFAAIMEHIEPLKLKDSLPHTIATTSSQRIPGQLLADITDQLLSAETTESLSALLKPTKLASQLNLVNSLSIGLEGRIEAPLLNLSGNETAQTQLQQFPTLPLANLNTSHSSTQLAQPSVVTSQLPLPVPHPNWGQQLTERVVWIAQQGVKTAHIQLDPPDLGMVEVRVQVTQDQANVQFTSHHASVRESIEAQLVRLREMFSQQGIDLVNVDVSSQQFSESNRHNQPHGAEGDADDELDSSSMTDADITQQGVGLVDYFA